MEQTALLNSWNFGNRKVDPGGNYFVYSGRANLTATITIIGAYVCPSDSQSFYSTNYPKYNYAVNWGNTSIGSSIRSGSIPTRGSIPSRS